jgi:methionyl-tRNA formyltransferase
VLNIIFAGTPEFAVPALQALIDAGHHISMVLTQPDRPAGRGMKLTASPVKQLALSHAIRVYQPETLKSAEVQAEIAAVQADVMIVAAYGLIIPTPVLAMPRLGCYNIHASLLPRWRGAAPIQRAMLAGDSETGVTIMHVVPALDAGDMVSKVIVPITEQDTAQSLHDALSQAGARLMVEAMANLESQSSLSASVQDESLVTYAAKLQKSEASIDWQLTATTLSRQIRAFNPFPVAHALWQGEVCRIWMASRVEPSLQQSKSPHQPGEIVSIEPDLIVACGEGWLKLDTLQLPGGKRLAAREFIAGRNLKVGQFFA